MEYVIVLIVVAVVIYAVSSPFRTAAAGSRAVAPSGPAVQDPVAELQAARDAKYREIRDAELDVRTGKLSDQDYAALDRTLRGEAIEILHALDSARESESLPSAP